MPAAKGAVSDAKSVQGGLEEYAKQVFRPDWLVDMQKMRARICAHGKMKGLSCCISCLSKKQRINNVHKGDFYTRSKLPVARPKYIKKGFVPLVLNYKHMGGLNIPFTPGLYLAKPLYFADILSPLKLFFHPLTQPLTAIQ